MRATRPLCPERVRKMTGRGACLEHRVGRDGLGASRSPPAWLLDIFLVLEADRHGLSSGRFEPLWALGPLALEEDLRARNARIPPARSAFDGHLGQGLSRPPCPRRHPPTARPNAPPMAPAAPAPMRHLIRHALGAEPDGPTPPLGA